MRLKEVIYVSEGSNPDFMGRNDIKSIFIRLKMYDRIVNIFSNIPISAALYHKMNIKM